jgi:hypothetical protein
MRETHAGHDGQPAARLAINEPGGADTGILESWHDLVQDVRNARFDVLRRLVLECDHLRVHVVLLR